jgi:hypothetical protein
MSYTKTYQAWSDMKDRCSNSNTSESKYYKDKGVEVCERWKNSFSEFFKNMGEAPEGYSLSRHGDKGNYEPGNVTWKPRSENSSEAFRGDKNVKAKLTEEQVLCIRALQVGSNPKYYRAPLIAQKLNTSRQTINNILKRRTWTHI